MRHSFSGNTYKTHIKHIRISNDKDTKTNNTHENSSASHEAKLRLTKE
jgi:hypothetical protein